MESRISRYLEPAEPGDESAQQEPADQPPRYSLSRWHLTISNVACAIIHASVEYETHPACAWRLAATDAAPAIPPEGAGDRARVSWLAARLAAIEDEYGPDAMAAARASIAPALLAALPCRCASTE